MKITGWTDADNHKYINIDESGFEFDELELRDLIVQELRAHGYKFTGEYHQYGRYGLPIIDGKYTVMYSQRMWGGIMEEAYPLHPGDRMAYCYWAWDVPEGEEQVTPSGDSDK